jgi:tripartite-type tricarboxylate transporter receptor subunit TctC
MVAYSWYGLLAPAALPDALAELLNKAANEALSHTAVQERLVAEGAAAPALSRRQFGELIERHSQVWAKTITPLNLQLD